MRPFDPALLRALPATRGPVALLSGIGVVAGVVAIAQAVVLGLVVGRVATGAGLSPALGWLVALLALRGVLAGLVEYVARWAGQRVVAVVRLAVVRHYLGLPEGRRPSSEVAVTRATEGVAALEDYVARYLPALVTGVVVPALAVVTLLVVDPWSALIVLLTLPLLPVFAALIGMHTRDETERRWGAMTLLAGHFLDVVRGLPTLVGYGRARAQVGVVREVGERHRSATMRTLRTAFLSSAALELLATISVAMVAVAVGLRLAYGAMDLTVGLTAILLAPEAYWPVRRVGQEFHNAADGATVLEELAADGVLRAEDALPAEPEQSVPATRPAEAAQARTCADEPVAVGVSAGRAVDDARGVGLVELSYAHPGRERTVVDVSLSAPAGPGLTALVGPSGAGKTTVLELLAGLRLPDEGRVEAPRAHLATQRPVLLPGTVRENLALATGVDPGAGDEGTGDEAMVRALRAVGLWDQLAEREGLGTELGEDGFGLSAGQRARLALARALLSDTPLVLLDEPTANVAAASVPVLHGVIQDLARERRVVVVTHDPALAELADEVWHLDPAPLAPATATIDDACDEHVCHKPSPGMTCGTRECHNRGETDAGQPALVSQPTPALADGPAPGEVEPLPLPQGRRGLWVACLLGGASVSCGVALTATSGWLIVQASTMPVVLTLMVAIVGVRAFGIFRPVFRYAERVVSHDVALADLAGRRADVFARLIPLTPARLGRRSRGEVLTAVVRDLDDVIDEQVRVVVPAWSAAIASVVGTVLAAWHLPAAGLAVGLGALLVLGIALAGHAAERSAQATAVQARGEVRHRTTAIVSRLLPVQAVTGLSADRDRLLAPITASESAQQHAEQRLITARALALAAAWVVVAVTVGVVAALTAGAHAAGQLSGPFAALVALVPMALADTWVGAADIAGARARARAAAARLEQVLGQTPAVTATGEGRPASTAVPTISLDGAGASWTGGATTGISDAAGAGGPAAGTAGSPTATGAGTSEATGAAYPHAGAALDLAPLDLHLAPGSRVALTGPNGVGKSTALAVLARHLDPATGSYAHDDEDVRDLDLDAVRARLAVVDDEPHAFAGTVRANLVLAAPDATDAELVEALHAVDLGHWFATLPDGLDTPLTGLSGGERSRLSLARALVSGRPVVLLDEPTAHLDDATADRALAGLLRTGDEHPRTFVLVSHRPGDPDGWTSIDLSRPLAEVSTRP